MTGFSKRELFELSKDNPQNFERKLATGKWQLGLRDALEQSTIPEEGKKNLWDTVQSIQDNSDTGNYEAQRKGVKEQYNILSQDGGKNSGKI